MFRYLWALCVLVGFALVTPQASASLSDYTFSVTSGRESDMTSSTALWRGSSGSRNSSSVNNVVTGIDLPFVFRFDGVDYTRISVSSNGLVGFGDGDVTASGNRGGFGSTGSYPAVAAWWDELTLTGGAQNQCSASPMVHWVVTGSAPNRVVTIEWQDVETVWRNISFATFQVRLLEGSNVIEFYYPNLTSTSCGRGGGAGSTAATIGIAVAGDDFMSVVPDGESAWIDRRTSQDNINLADDRQRIADGVVYRFAPCNVSLTGNVAQGGTMLMVEGDRLMTNIEVQRGGTASFQPFSIDNVTGECGPRTFAVEITGPAAAEYSVDMTSGRLGQRESVTPTITFSPNGPGARTATITITDDNQFRRSFTLAGNAGTRMEWLPSMVDGGTARMANGDSLMTRVEVRRRTSRDLMPFTLRNFNDNPDAPAAVISISLDSAGERSTQYEIVGPTMAELRAGEEFTPVIRFTGEGVGPQTATLTVVADDEVRTFTLRAVSAAPAVAVTANGVAVDAANPALNLAMTCVGDAPMSVPFVLTNFGVMPLVVTGVDVYALDTMDRQGTPAFPLVRDARGMPVAMADYVISETPNGPALTLPLTVARESSRTLYLTYIGAEPGKRFGRLFMRTNAENFYGVDTTAMRSEVLGLFTTDFTARAVGSQLASNANGLRLRPVVFAHTHVGDTATMSFTIANGGACDLRIDRSKLRVFSGDVNEFQIVRAMNRTPVDALGQFVLAPGAVDTITVRFVPSRAGTRLATLFLQTNDSTLRRPGLAERGAYYLDLHGRGLAGLDGRDLTLSPVLIGGSVDGTAVLENTLNIAIGVDRAYFDGGDAAQFSQVSWPTIPTLVLPGQKLELGVRLTPTGDAGVRRTTLVLITGSGDTVRVGIRGEAGTQALTVSPTAMFENVSVLVGQSKRQSLMIANSGTMPVRITSIALRGADSALYRLGALPRRDLEAGQTEYVEVTFVPTDAGQTSAEIVVTASNGQTYTVLLGGTAMKVRGNDPAEHSVVSPNDFGTPERARMGENGPTIR